MRWLGRARAWWLLLAVLLADLVSIGCSRHTVQAHLEAPFPKRLSEWQLFTATSPRLTPNDRVVPYDLNTPLFSDYASKYRFV